MLFVVRLMIYHWLNVIWFCILISFFVDFILFSLLLQQNDITKLRVQRMKSLDMRCESTAIEKLETFNQILEMNIQHATSNMWTVWMWTVENGIFDFVRHCVCVCWFPNVFHLKCNRRVCTKCSLWLSVFFSVLSLQIFVMFGRHVRWRSNNAIKSD